jgi:flagellar export protein FliJ
MVSLRRRKEEQAAARLAKRLASIQELQSKIDSFNQELADLAADLKEKGRSGLLNGPLLMLYSKHQERVREDLKKSLELLSLSRKEEIKERQALKKAVMERQVIEKIKENQKETWFNEMMKTQQNNMEELASLARSRRQREATDGLQTETDDKTSKTASDTSSDIAF